MVDINNTAIMIFYLRNNEALKHTKPNIHKIQGIDEESFNGCKPYPILDYKTLTDMRYCDELLFGIHVYVCIVEQNQIKYPYKKLQFQKEARRVFPM